MTARLWIDGEVAGADVAAAIDSGWLVGDGVFETMRVVDGRAVELDRHLARLRRGAEQVGVELPGDDRLRALVAAAADAARAGDLLRLTTVTRGDGASTVVTSLHTAVPRTDPADVVVVPWPRNERGALAGVKSVSFGENQVALRHAVERGADEALFADTQGRLCEGSRCNVFVAFGERLVTPPLDAGCLPGVTRELVLDAGIGVEEHVEVGRLAAATEMFLTSSGRGAQPVASVDRRPLPVVDGELTRRARAAISRSGGGG